MNKKTLRYNFGIDIMDILDNNIQVDVIGFGALNLDKIYYVNDIACHDEESFIKDFDLNPGGSAANTIIGLSRLGVSTSYIGKVADDEECDTFLCAHV